MSDSNAYLLGYGVVVHGDAIYVATPRPDRALERMAAEYGDASVGDVISDARRTCIYRWPMIPELEHLRFRRAPTGEEMRLLEIILQARSALSGAFMGDKDAQWRYVSVVYRWAANYDDAESQGMYAPEIRQIGKYANVSSGDA
ncbi:MAG: hypothetical protein QXS54_02945 [Candidatus Methanomethylicaceae archaeon]